VITTVDHAEIRGLAATVLVSVERLPSGGKSFAVYRGGVSADDSESVGWRRHAASDGLEEAAELAGHGNGDLVDRLAAGALGGDRPFSAKVIVSKRASGKCVGSRLVGNCL
jgi:hypothetical protein